MRDTINKQALIDHLNSGANDLFERGAIVPSGILVLLRDEIEEGKFDTPSDQGEVALQQIEKLNEALAESKKRTFEQLRRAEAAEKKADKFSIEIYCKDQQLLELENELKRRKMQAEINISIGETVINLQQENAELRQDNNRLRAVLERINNLEDPKYTSEYMALYNLIQAIVSKALSNQGEETKE